MIRDLSCSNGITLWSRRVPNVNAVTTRILFYIPALLLGVCVILDPAPIPACLGVPGTIILELAPLDSLVAKASSTAFFADLHKISTPRQ
jgi:hypothetical protein